jgi:hypothetical protein
MQLRGASGDALAITFKLIGALQERVCNKAELDKW